MPGTPVATSPWKGGMNDEREASTIEDTEASEATNLEFTADGTAVSRPAIVSESAGPRNYVLSRRNLVTNGSGEAGTTGWVAIPGTTGVAAITNPAPTSTTAFGTKVIKCTWSTASTAPGGGVSFDVAVTAGTIYSFWLCHVLTSIINRVQLQIEWRTAVGTISTVTTAPQVVTVANAVVENSTNYKLENLTAPPTATIARVKLITVAGTSVANWSIASFMEVDALVAEVGTTSSGYYDGNTADTGSFDYEFDGTADLSTSSKWAKTALASQYPLTLLGYYVQSDGDTYAVVADDTATYLYHLDAQTWTTIWSEPAAGFVQYLENAVLISETVAGGYWTGTVFTSTPTMPLGSQIVFYQERFWAFGKKGTANANTVWFSNLTVISPPSSIFTWTTASDFFEVGSGDGQWITSLQSDSNALIIFRNLSTYQFTFPALPIDGTLRRLSGTNGADNKFCVVPYEGYYFVLNQGHVYQFISYQFYAIDVKKVQLTRTGLPGGAAADYRLSVLGNRLIVWYLGTCLVFNAVSSTWSRWISEATYAAHFIQAPPDPLAGDMRVAYAVTGESDATKYKLYRVQEDVLQVGEGETFECILRTKSYAFDQPGEHKLLAYWAAEVASSTGITGYLHPQALAGGTSTWDQMSAVTWDTLDLGNWDNPLVIPTVVIDDVTYPMQAPSRMLVKLVSQQAQRFLRIIFELRTTIDGTVSTAPFRIYSITPYLYMRARASRKVS